MFPTLLRRVALVAVLAGGTFALAPSDADAASTLCKKKKAKKAKRHDADASASIKITSTTIKGWQKDGLSDDEILERCNQAGYQPTKLGLSKMKKAKVRPSIIAALSGGEPAEAAPIEASAAMTAPAPKKIEFGKPMEDSEIDFDSVAPPAGTPAAEALAKKQGQAKPVAKVEVKEDKKLDTSLRPAAPFIPKPATLATAEGSAKPKRVVYTAAN